MPGESFRPGTLLAKKSGLSLCANFAQQYCGSDFEGFANGHTMSYVDAYKRKL
jgi:hypothetical protein